jgi:hypothetical protein
MPELHKEVSRNLQKGAMSFVALLDGSNVLPRVMLQRSEGGTKRGGLRGNRGDIDAPVAPVVQGAFGAEGNRVL